MRRNPFSNLNLCSIVVGAVIAAGGPAAASSIGLLGHLNPSGSNKYADVWGWVDSLTSKEYALLGNGAGLHIVDVTDPTLPVAVSVVTTAPQFDIKTWDHYVYTVDGLGGAGGDGKVIDIANPVSPVVVGSFPGAHNVFIDDQGYMYAALPGLRIYDLNNDPTAPALVWELAHEEGHDAAVFGDRLYFFFGTQATLIYDVTLRTSPFAVGAITDSTIAFHHHGWESADGNYLFLADELAFHPSPDITVWDVTSLPSPIKVGSIADSTATAHNCYVIDNYLYVSYYLAGFRVYDVTDPTQPVLVDTYDTNVNSGEGIYEGSWGCYPFAPSGNIYVTDRPSGLFVFRFDSPASVILTPSPAITLHQNYPNPFNPVTTIAYHLLSAGDVHLAVYDVSGRLVQTLVDSRQASGDHVSRWDGNDGGGARVSSGVYFYRLRAAGMEQTRKMVLLQ